MPELMIHLENDSRKPLYEQIYDYIRMSIADGKISRGEKLPSTRFLAGHLQISRSTVELAYEQLLSEGYIESKPYKGYYASDISELYLGEEKKEQTKREEQRLSDQKKIEEEYQIVFSPDRNDFEYFPYSTWRKISKEILSVDDPYLLYAGEAAGERALREAVCSYLYHARGVKCRVEQIVVGAGNEYLLILLAQVLGTKKRVAVENPTYLKAYRTLENMQYEMIPLERDASGIKIEEVQKMEPDIVYTMPSHQFPMGTVMPLKRRLELLHWAAEKEGRYIIEDDHDSEFRYKGKPIPSLQGSDTNGNVIYIGTFSKSISPSIRVSYMVLPESLLDAYNATCGFYASTVPKEQQMILASFLNGGYFERYLNKMRGIYRGKHDYFLSLLKKEAWVHKIYGDHAGMHLLVELNGNMTAQEVVAAAKEKGLRIYDLEEYMIPGQKKQIGGYSTLLLGYGALNEAEMEKGIKIIRSILFE